MQNTNTFWGEVKLPCDWDRPVGCRWHIAFGRMVHYRQKIWNIFHFIEFFIFCGACRAFPYLIYIPTSIYNFGGVISHSIAKWTAKVQKQLFWYFFLVRRWLEFLLSHCQIASYLFVCLLARLCKVSLFIYHIVWCDRQGISIVRTSQRRTLG